MPSVTVPKRSPWARSTEVECTAPTAARRTRRCAGAGRPGVHRIHPEQPRHYATLLDEGEDCAGRAPEPAARSATRSIDLQTYIFDKDDSAGWSSTNCWPPRRGEGAGADRPALGDLRPADPRRVSGAHQNFPAAVYNPTFGKARLNYFDYAGSVLCCFRRFNQRMHNKLLVIDDAIGVVGGRNYQDDYYDWDREYNFATATTVIAGPEARAMAANFDAFWRAQRSVPAERLNDVGRTLLREGVPALPPATRRPERVQRVSAEANDMDFVTVPSSIPRCRWRRCATSPTCRASTAARRPMRRWPASM
jgi:phosphatidylserine/phosphatidylglycerophosphate/cardiolipin synthase-like enzyme